MTQTAQNPSPLANWPIQVQLAPLTAPYFKDADLLIAASCTAFAHGQFAAFTEGKPLLVTPGQVRQQIAVMEKCHQMNPLSRMDQE